MTHSLKLIRLHSTGPVGGNTASGYEVVVPVDRHDRLDTWAWHQARGACTVKRIASEGGERIGILTERHDGAWAFSYDAGDADDELLPRFNAQPFVVGRTVSVVGSDEIAVPYRIVETGPAIMRERPA